MSNLQNISVVFLVAILVSLTSLATDVQKFAYGSTGNTIQVGMEGYGSVAIIAPPSDAEAPSYGAAGFSVNATGAGLTYQWKFNNTDIPGATGDSLFLTNLTPAQFGSYAFASG